MGVVDHAKERVTVAGVFIGAALVVAMGVAVYGYVALQPARQASARNVAAAQQSKTAAVRQAQSLWARDDGRYTGPASDLPEEIPMIPDARLVWVNKDQPGQVGEAYGFATERDAAAVGIDVLQYYLDDGRWRLDSSEVLGLSGRGWAAVLTRPDTKVVVAYFALPEQLGPSGGPNNLTHISVFKLTAEEAKHGLPMPN